jgi:hypothetical protein
MIMSCRPLAILLVGLMTTALFAAPARAQGPQGPTAPGYKEDVLRLSKWIDDYLERRWAELGVEPAPLAEHAIFFRRLSLDLTGKIPELLQVVDFLDQRRELAEDQKKPQVEQKYPGVRPIDINWKYAEMLLNLTEKDNPRKLFDKHFANFWRTNIIGRTSNQQFQGFFPQFEAWVEERLSKNTPLDEMTRQVLTAQNAGPNQPFQAQIAGQGPLSPVGFIAVNEGKPENLAGASARVFLGVKIECAQCHKHPFAKWTREQFWEFAAFFSGQNGFGPQQQPVKKGEKRPNFTPGREIVIPEVNKVVKAKYLDGEEPKWGAFSDSRKVLADWMTSADNPYFARAMADHLWQYFFGVSLQQPIQEPSDDSPVTHPELLDKLAQELIAHKFDQTFLIRALIHTNAYQRSSGGPELATKEDYDLFVRMPIRSLTPEQIFDSIADATRMENRNQVYDMRFANQFPFQNNSLRGQFLAKFGTQDRHYDPQTSILQALFMMNGKFMAERTKAEINPEIASLAKETRSAEKKLRTMFLLILSRPPRQEELARLVPYLESGGPTGRVDRAIEDVYWALLNSPEFVLNH